MSDQLKKEIQAITTVLGALDPLDPDVRVNVLDYVVRRLKIQFAPSAAPPGQHPSEEPRPSPVESSVPAPGIHIEKFKDQKNPKSANEMAALVAYYFANLAPEPQRKATVNSKDIETYFKIANFPLPREIRVTLQNARNAGYFDSVGDGEYRLNAVGHNLVVHNLPRAGAPAARAKKTKSGRPQSKRRSS